MHGTTFEADMRSLPLSGCDLVLGVEWLAMFGPIMYYYKNLKIEFMKKRKRHVLRWSMVGLIKLVWDKSSEATNYGAMARIYSIHPNSTLKTINFEVCLEYHFVKLLSQFELIFSKPKDLLPLRAQDNKIPLKPSCSAINVRPYRYLYFQKNEIERFVWEMLEARLIRPSMHPDSHQCS